ncbi:MAG: YgiQ family radical SAM protein, partial [Deltaproteobacteria bacterium]|nr:YgiQ family radical SAM protein [Deltaproteobacteria bacterium]
EASLRRATHYDFWSDSLRRSILLDAKADLLVYGMAERALLEIAQRLEAAEESAREVKSFSGVLNGIPGTVYAGRETDLPVESRIITLPSHEEIQADPRALLTATMELEDQVHQGSAWAVQRTGDRLVILTPPADPLTTEEMDRLYNLPFTRTPHPTYRETIPAMEMLAASVTTHRGCGGGCAFCSLALHQGRRISSRSDRSIVDEVHRLTGAPQWRGSLSDVGGPSANMWGAVCARGNDRCRRPSCLVPEICRHFRVDQDGMVGLLRTLKNIPGVEHVRVASGLRHDLALTAPKALKALVSEFVGGQLKVAPEHSSDRVLKLMRKPGIRVFEKFMDFFQKESRRAGKEQYLVPYLLSALPGCTDADMKSLADWLKERSWRPRQVQCFIPTPGTLATAMYFAGESSDGQPIFVARTDAQRQRQHRIFGLPKEESGGKRVIGRKGIKSRRREDE